MSSKAAQKSSSPNPIHPHSDTGTYLSNPFHSRSLHPSAESFFSRRIPFLGVLSAQASGSQIMSPSEEGMEKQEADPPSSSSSSSSISSSNCSWSVPLLGLPEDVLGLISRHLRPVDICSLIQSCRSLRSSLSASDKVWLTQCQRIGPPSHLLSRWRDAGPITSYQSLCRFLLAVHPLLGIWVHQNPELGNVVCVVWGFLSVVGCRVIPQELGPLGLDASPLLWAPVFEIVAASDGSIAAFFLHGRERDATVDSLYPGSIKSIDPSCNVLLLEVDASEHRPSLSHTNSLISSAENRGLCRSDTTVPRSSPAASFPFSRLAFGDRRRLLEHVSKRVRIKVPADMVDAPLFPVQGCTDMAQLAARRELLMQMDKLGREQIERREVKSELDLCELLRNSTSRYCDDGSVPGSTTSVKRRSLSFSMAGYFRDGLRQVFGKASSANGATVISKNRCPSSSSSSASSSSSNGESKHVLLHEFLRNGDMVGLSLRASNVKLITYKAWPNMHDNRFALYKLPLQDPIAGREYAGLWGGTFGWPPGQISEDKPAKALFFLLLSYEETHRLLIATKILEGTHYVLHPNGSAMFIVKVDEPSSDPFPWGEDGGSLHVEVKHSYSGEGIANGYGFRYPSSKPGSLFVTQNGLLAFVWKETRAVLTLQRLDVEELLKKGERVPALPPIANFAYLTKSYSNVFAGYTNNYSLSSSQRFVL